MKGKILSLPETIPVINYIDENGIIRLVLKFIICDVTYSLSQEKFHVCQASANSLRGQVQKFFLQEPNVVQWLNGFGAVIDVKYLKNMR